MKIFVYKVLFLVICLFLLFNFTIGYQMRKFENKIQNISSDEKIQLFKQKIKEEIRKGIKKDKIFKEEEKVLIKNFIKKIINELELNKLD